MNNLLINKNALVTGASMGIGRAVALDLARNGARVVVNSSGNGPEGPGSNPEPLHDLVRQIEAFGGHAIASCGSVADYQYAGELIETCVEGFGSIDVLINIAGVGEGNQNSILNMDPDNWQHVVGVHLNGTFNTCRQAAPHMVAQGSGSIINTGSHAFLGSYGGTAYAAAKGGINSLSAAIAKDLAEYRVRCNLVMPGAKTRLSTGADYEANIRDLNNRGLLDDQRMASAFNAAPPEYIATLYAFLASDRASDFSGKMFSASGMHLGQFPLPVEKVLAVKASGVSAPWSYEEIEQYLGDDL